LADSFQMVFDRIRKGIRHFLTREDPSSNHLTFATTRPTLLHRAHTAHTLDSYVRSARPSCTIGLRLPRIRIAWEEGILGGKRWSSGIQGNSWLPPRVQLTLNRFLELAGR
jgi:hypothetical protein